MKRKILIAVGCEAFALRRAMEAVARKTESEIFVIADCPEVKICPNSGLIGIISPKWILKQAKPESEGSKFIGNPKRNYKNR